MAEYVVVPCCVRGRFRNAARGLSQWRIQQLQGAGIISHNLPQMLFLAMAFSARPDGSTEFVN